MAYTVPVVHKHFYHVVKGEQTCAYWEQTRGRHYITTMRRQGEEPTREGMIKYIEDCYARAARTRADKGGTWEYALNRIREQEPEFATQESLEAFYDSIWLYVPPEKPHDDVKALKAELASVTAERDHYRDQYQQIVLRLAGQALGAPLPEPPSASAAQPRISKQAAKAKPKAKVKRDAGRRAATAEAASDAVRERMLADSAADIREHVQATAAQQPEPVSAPVPESERPEPPESLDQDDGPMDEETAQQPVAEPEPAAEPEHVSERDGMTDAQRERFMADLDDIFADSPEPAPVLPVLPVLPVRPRPQSEAVPDGWDAETYAQVLDDLDAFIDDMPSRPRTGRRHFVG